ncbi:MAG: hypothetical protein ABH828_03090 [archaeon]
MNIAEQAFKELFPDKKLNTVRIEYSNKFKAYNANVKYNNRQTVFNLSSVWKDVSEEIQIGLIQSLLLKIFKDKKRTLNIELYNQFLKNLPKYASPQKINSFLEKVFNRVNKKYFHNFMDTPNLVWGRESFHKLGSYEYASDTITISTVIKEEQNLLDYVMYHEMLHKKFKFASKNGRNYHHTAEFRREEKKFEDLDAEKKLTSFLRKKRFKKAFRFF